MSLDFVAADSGVKIRFFCPICGIQLSGGNMNATAIIGHPMKGAGCANDGKRWTAIDVSLTEFVPA